MEEKRFNPNKLQKLNNLERLKLIPPVFILDKAKLVNPEVIIDLGAGTGFFSAPIAKTYTKSKVYACDISDVMVDWMKENISPKYENIIPMKMDDSSIELESNVADFLFMINLHHELDNPEKTLTECNRLLKPGGKIAICDWKKIETEHGPSISIRVEPEQVKEQLLATEFDQVNIFNEMQNNFLVIAQKKVTA